MYISHILHIFLQIPNWRDPIIPVIIVTSAATAFFTDAVLTDELVVAFKSVTVADDSAIKDKTSAISWACQSTKTLSWVEQSTQI